MGFWAAAPAIIGAVGALKKKGSRASGAGEYSSDAYFNWQPRPGGGSYQGPGAHRTIRSDQLAFDALERLGDRPPGLTDEELRSIYSPAAGEIDLGTQASNRNVNRIASQTGGYGSGGHKSKMAASTERGARAKAGLQFDTRALAAKVALEDRYRRIAALQGYADPRLAMMMGEQGRRNDFTLGRVGGDQWATQYNNQRNSDNIDRISEIASTAAQYWGNT